MTSRPERRLLRWSGGLRTVTQGGSGRMIAVEETYLKQAFYRRTLLVIAFIYSIRR